MSYPLYVAFVWHMHQPYYKDFTTGEYILPWARLHGAKSYMHMVDALAQYPDIKATFNFVPSLVDQLDEYASGQAIDYALKLSRQDDWSLAEKEYLLSFFFSINWDRIVRRYPRYRQLLDLRHQTQGQAGLLGDDFYYDLIAWFNLVWIDPTALENDPELSALVEKDRGFTRADIDLILEKQRQVIAQVLPRYQELYQRGQIELMVSPYYHPILPLLISSDLARRASPGLAMPATLFQHGEDALEQIRRAVRTHTQRFGVAPKGMWPSEGSVSPEQLPLMVRNNIRWFATDEAILGRSTGYWLDRDAYGHLNTPSDLYQPYWVCVDGDCEAIAAIFRDHTLSDRIGFVYQDTSGREGAEDLIHRLQVARQRLGDGEPYLVSIILDGENCWESYPDFGRPFLHHLYRRLGQEEGLQTTTVSAYLEQFPPRRTVHHLATGSWIGGNLETWIGEAEQNRAWELLGRVRDDLVRWQNSHLDASFDVLSDAWRQVYIAEGSDWFWWYYSRNNSGQDHFFDQTFREHLSAVYFTIGHPVPAWLTEPITGLTSRQDVRQTSGYITPHLTAAADATLDWTGAGYVDNTGSSGTMQRAEELVLRRLYFGYNPTELYFRLESRQALASYDVSLFLVVTPAGQAVEQLALPSIEDLPARPPFGANWRVDFRPGQSCLLRFIAERGWVDSQTTLLCASGERVWEMRVPRQALGLKDNDLISVGAAIFREGNLVEQLPGEAAHRFELKVVG